VNVKNFILFFFTTLFLSTAGNTWFIKLVEDYAVIYIKSDGSVEPLLTSVEQDGNVYTFTDDIYGEIVVERDNIVIDGAGYTLQGKRRWDSKGIDLTGRSRVTIKNIIIKAFFFGIWLKGSSSNDVFGNYLTNNKVGIWVSDSLNNSFYRNDITENLNYGLYIGHSSINSIYRNQITANHYYGIYLENSSSNNIYGNTIKDNVSEYISNVGIQLYSSSYKNIISENIITNNTYGILLWKSFSNYIYGNNISKNDCGILITNSSSNKIYHNNFLNNKKQIDSSDSTNIWDIESRFGGNYWSDYKDAPYVIDEKNLDNYPLTNLWIPIEEKAPIWTNKWIWTLAAVALIIVLGLIARANLSREWAKEEKKKLYALELAD